MDKLKRNRSNKNFKNDINSNTFELNLLLLVDSLKKKDFKQANKRFKEFKFNKDDGTYEYVIYKILKDFNYLFLKKETVEIISMEH